jgi:hypothetical protein
MLRSDQPIKWSKYLLLVQFGFLTIEELRNDIQRYKRSDRLRCFEQISSEIKRASGRSGSYLYVVKLVPLGIGGRLPNYRLETTADLTGLGRFFASYENTDYVEIWYCRTRIDEDVFSVAGRFVFTPRDNHQAQAVEQLWRCSPRLLEYYAPNFPYSYLRASRYSWGWPYEVQAIHSAPGGEQSQRELLNDFRYAMRVFESMREPLSVFLAFLDSFGFTAYSIEYKLVGSRLQIIDWDTPEDRRVVIGGTSAQDLPL